MLEIVKDFDGTYYCNLKGIEQYVSLKQLKKELKQKYNVTVKPLKELESMKMGRKTYFYQN